MSQLYWLDHLTSACFIREGGVKLSEEVLEKIYLLFGFNLNIESCTFCRKRNARDQLICGR